MLREWEIFDWPSIWEKVAAASWVVISFCRERLMSLIPTWKESKSRD